MAQTTRVDRPEGWAVVDARGVPIAEVTAYLRHLHAIERSPNTIKGYASDLALYFTFNELRDLAWTALNNETLGKLIAWLRTPDERLVRRTNPAGIRTKATVNRALAAVAGLAEFLHDTTGDQVYAHLLKTARVRENRFGESSRTEVRVGPRLRPDKTAPDVLADADVAAILDGCLTLRDRFLFSTLNETGMRIGQALLLRHEDIRVPASSIWVQRREGDRRDRHELLQNKSEHFAEVPVPPWLIRLYAAYMNSEYGMLDCDFVFVNLWAGRVGERMSYTAVDKLVGRLQRRTGVAGWSAHTFRHTYVTRLLDAGVSPEVVAYLVTHASVVTTLNTYSHANVEKIRAQLIRTGAWTDAS